MVFFLIVLLLLSVPVQVIAGGKNHLQNECAVA